MTDLKETKKLVDLLNYKRNKFNNTFKIKWRTHPRKIEIKQLKNKCIICVSHKQKNTDYYRVSYDGEDILLHRLLYIMKNKKINAKMFICHTCDNRKCININHLWIGTQHKNNTDMSNKNRCLFGEKHPNSKLTNKKVKEIIKLTKIKIWKNYSKETSRKNKKKGRFIHKYLYKVIAKKFKISVGRISYIVYKRNWRRLQ